MVVVVAPGASLVTTRLPFSLVEVALVQPTLKPQLAPGARLKGAAAQPLADAGATVKPPLPMASALTWSTAVPLFCKTSVCAAATMPVSAEKLKAEGETDKAAAGAAVAVPVRLTLGGAVPSEASVNVALRVPAAVGVKPKTTVQVLPTASELPAAHVPVPRAKSEDEAPETVMAVKCATALPPLDKLSVCGVLLLPTVRAPKSSVVVLGVQDSTGASTTATPVPLRLSVSGEVAALVVMVRLPDRAPVVVGVKLVLRLQALPADRFAGQLWLRLKSLPLAERLLMDSVAEPVLVSVTTLAFEAVPTVWLPKAMAAADKLTAGCGVAVPVPESASEALPLLALLAKVRVALRLPVAAGVKPSTSVQLAPAATGEAVLQVPPRVKSPAPVPLRASPVKFSAAVPLLVTVTNWVAPAVPTACDPKLRLVALIDKVGTGTAFPVPLSATVVGEFAALWITLRTALRRPAAAGVKVTTIVHELLGATLLPAAHVPPAASANSPGLAPERPRLLTTSAAVPVLLSVRVWLALVLPTVVAASVKALLEIEAGHAGLSQLSAKQLPPN